MIIKSTLEFAAPNTTEYSMGVSIRSAAVPMAAGDAAASGELLRAVRNIAAVDSDSCQCRHRDAAGRARWWRQA